MSPSSLNSKAVPTTPSFELGQSLRELATALPLVIFVKAIAEALKSSNSRSGSTTLQTSSR